MITRLAVAGYRSLRDLVFELDRFTLITGPNGSGKSSLYRALRLLSEAAQGRLMMRQPGLLRPLGAKELSDGTLRYLLLTAALLSPRPPEIMILNEPEASLHPSLLDALARLLMRASRTCQIVLVSHSERLIESLRENYGVHEIALDKQLGETRVDNLDPPSWTWPKR